MAILIVRNSIFYDSENSFMNKRYYYYYIIIMFQKKSNNIKKSLEILMDIIFFYKTLKRPHGEVRFSNGFRCGLNLYNNNE